MASLNLVQTFDRWMSTRGMSDATRKRRRVSLRAFGRFCAPLPITEATPDLIDEWLSTFDNKRTRHAYRSDLAAFFAWASRRRVVDVDPMLDVDPIRQPRSLPRPVPPQLVPSVIASADGRLRLALMLAAFAGLRRAEICALDASDVSLHPSRPVIVVRNGKGDKDRVVPMHPELVRAFMALPRDGLVVPWCPDHLGRRATAHMASLGLPFTLHSLRGSCATELARVTKGDVVRIARILGHSDTNTTMGYIGFGDDTLPEMAEMFQVA